jgi:hypothetical protein
MAMADKDKEEILRAIADLRDEMKADNNAVWAAITKLNAHVAMGQGAVKALVWVGTVVLGLAAVFAAFLNAMRH